MLTRVVSVCPLDPNIHTYPCCLILFVHIFIHTYVCMCMSSVCLVYAVGIMYVHMCVCLLSRMILPMFPLCATVLYTYAHIHTYVRTCVCAYTYVCYSYVPKCRKS